MAWINERGKATPQLRRLDVKREVHQFIRFALRQVQARFVQELNAVLLVTEKSARLPEFRVAA